MARVDEALAAARTAIRMVRGEQQHTVVTPASVTTELGDGHEFDRADTEFDEMVEMLDRSIEGALVAERADVEFIDDRAGKRPPSPQTIMPLERVVIDDMRPAVDAIGLPLRARIRHGEPIHDEPIAPGGPEVGLPRALDISRHRLRSCRLDLDLHRPRTRRPQRRHRVSTRSSNATGRSASTSLIAARARCTRAVSTSCHDPG